MRCRIGRDRRKCSPVYYDASCSWPLIIVSQYDTIVKAMRSSVATRTRPQAGAYATEAAQRWKTSLSNGFRAAKNRCCSAARGVVGSMPPIVRHALSQFEPNRRCRPTSLSLRAVHLMAAFVMHHRRSVQDSTKCTLILHRASLQSSAISRCFPEVPGTKWHTIVRNVWGPP